MNNKIESLKEFKTVFLKLAADAVRNGVPVQNVILELETEKFRWQNVLLGEQLEREAQAATKAIMPASFIPPARNGSVIR